MPTILPIKHISTKPHASPIVAMGIPIRPSTPLDPNITIPKIDFSKDYIILWVPGTDDHNIPAKFAESIRQMFGDNVSLSLCDYMATWQLQSSIANGDATLMQTLDYIRKHKKKSTKVMLAGLSQGSIVISDIMANPAYSSLVTRASLVGHPGVANHHFDNDRTVREFNNSLDFTTFDWDSDNEKIIQSVDMFLRGDVLAGVSLLKVGLHNPMQILWMAAVSLHRIPFLGFTQLLKTDPHNYTEYLDDAASWLNLGK
jgi:hypothetical protein